MTMGIRFTGLSSGLADTYSALLSGGTSSSQTDSMGSLLTDYASIKNGSYGKMMKAYCAKTISEEDSDTKASEASTESKKDTVCASAAQTAYKAAEKLSTASLSSDHMEEAYQTVSSFIDGYNSLIKNASASSNGQIQKQAEYLSDAMYTNFKLFAKIGITLNSDRTLSLNETDFKNSDIATVKTLFHGSGSFADKVSAKASQIYRYANDGGSVTAKTYTKNGSYSTTASTDSSINSTT